MSKELILHDRGTGHKETEKERKARLKRAKNKKKPTKRKK